MRILVLGSGAIGGYFGGRLVEKGIDVTFLVRNKRKQQLEKNGLAIHSSKGDFSFTPKLITKTDNTKPFDIVLLSSKAYNLKQAINDLKPFVGDKTVIIPLLNGVAHISLLKETFGDNKVIGGLCIIETTLNKKGDIVHSSAFDRLVFGELENQETNRIQKIAGIFSGTKANFVLSNQIMIEIWHKYLFITVMSGVTTLMRAPIGPICESDGGRDFIRNLFNEAIKIMRACKAPIADNIIEEHMKSIESLSYNFKTSMQRDMEKGLFIEGEHLQGYLLRLAAQFNIEAPFLKASYQNLKIYEEML
ncbi:2-dehydropantoate 2-reductase [Mammaliicoccus lentus]|uniref:2-dehydropantoate 2-reductase n=1 Tax=Mammaliicoccus lentus TaxID=42858 RepID=UPI002DB990A5|nr:2-dehydropantoate 2-reductase [Mammaliicoccus lentus]MEB8092872.1 2-dehydropantoate 2-reductase [Mammaliicoccus lentus]